MAELNKDSCGITQAIDNSHIETCDELTCVSSSGCVMSDDVGSSLEKCESTRSSSGRSDVDDAFGSVDEEEEPLSGTELSDLRKEGDMPLEELLEVYGCSRLQGGGGGEHNETYSSSEEEILSNQDLTLDKDEIARDLLMRSDTGLDHETSVTDLITIIDLKPHTHLAESSCAAGQPSTTHTDVEGGCSAGFDSVTSSFPLNDDDDDDDDDDSDYQPDSEESWRKTVSVGAEYQTDIPDCIPFTSTCPGDTETEEDKLLWFPFSLSADIVESYCRSVSELVNQSSQLSNAADNKSVSSSSADLNKMAVTAATESRDLYVRDDEQALYLLVQCGYNTEEALRRRGMETLPPSDPLSLWSVEEQSNFCQGLRQYGKDFYAIQQNKVRTRSVSELVQFYYLWKKTDQYRVFTSTRDRHRTSSSSSSSSGDEAEPCSSSTLSHAVSTTTDPLISLPHICTDTLPPPQCGYPPPSWQDLPPHHSLHFLPPYSEPLITDTSYYGHHHPGVGEGYCPPDPPCRPYHDPPLPPQYNTYPSDHLPYYHPTHHYSADPLAYVSPVHNPQVFYPPMPMIPGAEPDYTARLTYPQSHLSTAGLNDFVSMEPSVKRFKSCSSELIDTGLDVLGLDSRSSCDVLGLDGRSSRDVLGLESRSSCDVLGLESRSSCALECNGNDMLGLNSRDMIGHNEQYTNCSDAVTITDRCITGEENSCSSSSADSLQPPTHHITPDTDKTLPDSTAISAYSPFSVSSLQNLSTKMIAQ